MNYDPNQIRDKFPPFFQNLPEIPNSSSLQSDLEALIKETLIASSDESFCFLNEGRLRDRARLLRDYFLPEDSRREIIYAVKANPRYRILQIFSQEGIDGFDCASINEVDLVKRQNPDARIYFNNPVKAIGHISRSLEKGVRNFTVQNRAEIDKILRSAGKAEGNEKIRIDVRLATTNPEAKINLSKKFGASNANALSLLHDLHGRGIPRGISIHIGSQNSNPEAFRQGIDVMTALARQAGGVSSLNIGGGLPVNYHPNDQYNILEYLAVINEAVRQTVQDTLMDEPNGESRIIIELGRAMVAEAVDLVIPILSSETRDGEKCLYINDGVFTSFSDAVVHQWSYYFEALRNGEPVGGGEREPYRLFGRTCDSGDTLGVVDLPAGLQEGDHLWVKNAGAYLDCQASSFNGFDPPTYISYNV